MVIFYMLLSYMQLSTSHIILLNKRVLLIPILLFFCDECPDYMIPDEELYGIPNYPLINFSVYNYQGRCAKHGIIPNVTTLCKLCDKTLWHK